MTSALARHHARVQRTDLLPWTLMAAHETFLTCGRCKQLTALFEAAMGARTEAEHRFTDVTGFVCVRCLLADDDAKQAG